jgi:hypothetical protein
MAGFHRKRGLLGLLLAAMAVPAGSFQAPAGAETLHYGVEWRLIRAGTARLAWSPAAGDRAPQINLELHSAGVVNALYRVNNSYAATLAGDFCTASVFLHAEEGRRRRETRITFDAEQARSSYVERDLLKDTVVNQKEIDIAPCTHDVIAGLYRLRAARIALGQSMEFPVSDGKKFVRARVVAQAREQVKTPAGNYQTVRYEVFLFNDVLYRRKGRLFVWLTDDEFRVPVQIRARLQFHIGTITLQLEKQERS